MVGRGIGKRMALGVALGLLLALAVAALASAEAIQRGNLRVSFDGSYSPQALPRHGAAPIVVDFGGNVFTTDGAAPPQLRRVKIEINREGRLDHHGLPACRLGQLNPATTTEAVAACGDSIVGRGKFRAHVLLPEQSPFPSSGVITAFYGELEGRPVIFAHVYGSTPLPQSQVIVFRLGRGSGRFGTAFTAELPQVAAEWGYVSGLSLRFGRDFEFRGRQHSFLSADCPAPAGFPAGVFTLARAEFGFEDGRRLATTMTRSCHASG
jgi:hypothetical protein